MIKQVEDRSLGAPLELEGTEDEFSKSGKSKIKYTRALLLEFTEVEACCKLPRDFDLLILRQLDEESDGTMVHKSTSGNSSDHGPLLRTPLLRTRWNVGSPGEKWDNLLPISSRESRSQRNCSLERRDMVCQQPPQESGYDAGALGPKIQKSDLFQLSKSGNPYRPPHFNRKVPQPLATKSEPRAESSGDSDQRGSADSIAGNDKSGYGFLLAGVSESTKKSLGENNEGNEVIGANDSLREIIEDNQLSFDGFWAEILEIIRQQPESSISPTNSPADTPDSEVEIHSPDKENLISVAHSTVPENFNSINLQNSDVIAEPESEINLPDEDSLITIYDMIGPDSSIPILNSDSLEANKVTSNMAANIRQNSGSLTVTKQGDQSTTVSSKAQSSFDFSRFGRLRSPLPHSQTSTHIFVPGKTSLHLEDERTNFLPKFINPNIVPYIPTLNCFNCSNFHHRSCQESTLTTTKTNDPLVQYSVLQQPNIFLKHQNHPLVDTSCPNPTKQVATPNSNPMQFLPLTSQEAMHQGFGK